MKTGTEPSMGEHPSGDPSSPPVSKGTGAGIHETLALIRRKEWLIRVLWFFCALFAIITIFFILGFLLYDAYPIIWEIGLSDFLTGMVWNPTGVPPAYGIYSLIVDSLLVTFLAMAIAIPLGVGSAIYLAELAPSRVKAVLKPAVELLAGIPSVVLGFFGLIVLTDFIRVNFNVPSGETWLAGSILLGMMALPTIISVSEDAISSVPREFREGSFALGASHWQTISRVLAPAALSGITAAIILGIGRAVGETMAVLMVTGNAAVIPDPIWNVLSPVRTLTATLGIEMGEVAIGSTHYHALFGVAVVLLVITLVINLLATVILARIKEKHMGAKASSAKEADTRGKQWLSGSLQKYRNALIGSVLGLVILVISGLPGLLAALLGYAAFRLVEGAYLPEMDAEGGILSDHILHHLRSLCPRRHSL